jgi:uncharacterized protein involved in exopolysaccharide biosynthesis
MPAAADSAQTFAPFRLLVPLVVHRRALALIALAGGVLGLAVGFILPRRYTATARFTAQSAEGTGIGSSLAALADQFGLDVNIAAAGGGMSPAFYADLITTREILEPVVTGRYARQGGDSVDLREFIRARRGSPRRRIEVAIKKLLRRTDVSVHKSGLITVDVSLNDPAVSAGVANALLNEVNAFTVNRLQFQSRQQRLFAEERLDTAQAELRAAENAEAFFVERNRSYQQSPTLRVQFSRLQRLTQTKQEIVATLSRAYEEARLQEVRDMPTLTIVETGVPPARKSWPKRSTAALLGGFAALALAVIVLWLNDWFGEARRAGRADVVELVDAWRRTTSARSG